MRSMFKDPELEAAFRRDGYVVVPFLDPDEVATLIARFDQLGRAPGDPGVSCHSTFHSYDAGYKVKVHEAIDACFSPKVHAMFERPRTLPCNYLSKWPGGMSGFGVHQDLCLVDESQFPSAEIWCALTPTDERNGQLWVAPGSHAWTPTVRGIHSFQSPYCGVEKRILQRHSVPVPLAAGEAIIFHHATIHFSYPNRTDALRLVAITEVLPEEAPHLHYFGNDEGSIDVYEIDESFWVDNSPFTLYDPPAGARKVGTVEPTQVVITEQDLDRLVAEGRAVDGEVQRHGAINTARAWCHRCGTTESVKGNVDRFLGNVTYLCSSCESVERELAEATAVR